MLRQIDFNDTKIYTCPNGCDESDLEMGKDESSFMAMMGCPHKYIRCGKCLFGDENKRYASTSDDEIVSVWNKACELADEKEEGNADEP